MNKGLIVERVRQIAGDIAEKNGIELVHVEIGGTDRDAVIRIFIDKDGGVTLDDCSAFSHQVEAVLDAEDTVPVRYVLEISSPGIERELYSLKDFQRFTGQLVKVKTKTGMDGQKTFVGRLVAVDGETITVEDRTLGKVELDHADVVKANLKIDLAKEFGGR